MNTKFIAYYRVSTKQQGNSGLGLEAQKKSVLDFINGGGAKIVEEFTEVESGRKNERVELQKAFAACRVHGAILVVAKLDRLARDAHFLLGLKDAGIDFVCCDLPSANRLTVGIMAMVAEEEARLVSIRTKAALQAAKERGTKLGTPENLTNEYRLVGSEVGNLVKIEKANSYANDLAPIIREIQNSGTTTLKGISESLNARGIRTQRGKKFYPTSVKNILNRLIKN